MEADLQIKLNRVVTLPNESLGSYTDGRTQAYPLTTRLVQ